MSKPLCVCISDIHFSLSTLELASRSLKIAILKADELNVPLVIAGDLTDGKAIIRAEVANELIDIFKTARHRVLIYIIVGNHDLINEKGKENALHFLKPYVSLVDCAVGAAPFSDNVTFFPYYSDVTVLRSMLYHMPDGQILIMHQGVKGAFMGEYAQDNSSIDPEELARFTCISGHYHRHQTVGTLTYIGSPFTMNFAEANDGPKGFLVLNDDGTYTREILNLRKHVKIEWNAEMEFPTSDLNTGDLVWVKASGPSSILDKLDKQALAKKLGLDSIKLDKVYTDTLNRTPPVIKDLSDGERFDMLIENLSESDVRKAELKALWREIF